MKPPADALGAAPCSRSFLLLLAGWAAVALASLWLRPLWPVDETRYVAVAWEMWQRGDFLVPWVNGEPYSHKPPLLFWLIHLGWAVFGVNEWWPRLIAPLCALGTVPLLLKLEDLLGERNGISVWILFGTLLFAGFITLTMFDLLLMLCTLGAMVGVLELSRGARRAGLLWLGAGIGLGVLAKGPVILLHVLPTALVAPWWAPQLRGRLARWFVDLLLGVLLGAAIALAWALPAAAAGGEAYRNAILWGQTAGRVAESFAHRAPFWYYLPLLPLILFPWFVWPRFWSGVVGAGKEKDRSFRFLCAWLLLTVLGFSMVSGKQAKYLVPMLPAFALLAATTLERAKGVPRWWEMLPPVLGFLALPAGLAWIRADAARLGLPDWSSSMPLWPVVAAALCAPLLMLFHKEQASTQLRALAFAMLLAFTVVLAGVIPAFAPYADTAPAAQYLAAQQRLRIPLAHLGKYHAQYNFSGRLAAPVAILEARELAAWVRAHPAGQVITVERRPHGGEAEGNAQPEFKGRFRGAWVEVWRGERLLQARPELR